MKVAFVDRDGTINKDYQDDDWRYISEPEFLDGSLEALKVISEKGYQIVRIILWEVGLHVKIKSCVSYYCSFYGYFPSSFNYS